MSNSIRRNNLFAAEDWRNIYTSFLSNVNFVSYDYDTIRQALVEYIRNTYPENFNDWIKSSEFVAIMDLLAWLGENLAFRVDLNVRENFLDTAERRESIIKLANLLSYKPRRNINAKGFLKIVGIQTTNDIYDSNGQNLNGIRIDFNDTKNPDWYEQFILILNDAFDRNTQFGHPLQEGNDADNVRVEVYRIDRVPDGKPNVYNFTTSVNSESVDFEVVNVGFDGASYYEREPDIYGNFHILYKNDSRGYQSSNTGFFVYFKQGTLNFEDFNITEAIENRIIDINVPNINNDDVFVHSITEDGQITQRWKKLPRSIFSNIVFNNFPVEDKYIFAVDSRLNDQISVVFGDGRFAAVPFGLTRIYYRTSINDNLIIKPSDIQNVTITIPYVTNTNGTVKQLTLYLSLQETLSNSFPSETNEDIKINAARVFYTQNRMVNAEDYNNFPLSHPAILKLKAINRTYAGHSRYIDINDPTGEHRSLKVTGNDGILYRERENTNVVVHSLTLLNEDEIVVSYVIPYMKTVEFRDFLVYALHKNARACSSYASLFTFPPPGYTGIMWDLVSTINGESTGRFVDRSAGVPVPSSATAIEIGNSITASNPTHLMKEESYIRFEKNGWTHILSVIDNGKGLTEGFGNDGNGKVVLSKIIEEGDVVVDVIPPLRTDLSSSEIDAIKRKIANRDMFALFYNIKTDKWTVLNPPSGGFDEISFFDYCDDKKKWMILFKFDIPTDTMTILFRGERYVFESEKDVRFFFITPNSGIIDEKTRKVKRDRIYVYSNNHHPLIANARFIDAWVSGVFYEKDRIVKYRNSYYISLSAHTSNNIETDPWMVIYPLLEKDVSFVVEDNFVYNDGYIEPRKIIVSYDLDRYGHIEDPDSFDIVMSGTYPSLPPRYLLWEKYTDIDGYDYYRPFTVTRIFEDTTYSSALNAMNRYFDNPATRSLWQHGDTSLVIGNDNFNVFSFDIYDVYVSGDILPSGYSLGDIKRPSDQKIVDKNRLAIRQGRNNLIFLWEHVAPTNWRIDPSVSNIIDMYVLTENYDRLMRNWIQQNNDEPQPKEPSQTELRELFKDLNSIKMISDEIIWHPVKYKVLFGKKAREELQAVFKVIRLPQSEKSDGEIKAQIVRLVNEFFDVRNWEFGETFYFSELAAYIHQNMSMDIASVVIVPRNEESSFGNLFEIKAEPDEMFISSLTVDDIEIINTLTRNQLRIR